MIRKQLNRFTAFLLFFLLVNMHAVEKVKSEDEWELYKDKKGIKLYRRSVNGSRIKEFKGVTVLDERVEVIAMILRDIPGYTKWMLDCKKSEIIEKIDENNMIIYYLQKTLWFVKDRDVVLKATTKMDWESGSFTVDVRSIENPRVPLKKGLVRMTKMTGKWFIEYIDREHAKVTWTIMINYAGSIPAFLVNAYLKNIPYKTLWRMKQIAKEKKYIEAANKSPFKKMVDKYFKEKRSH